MVVFWALLGDARTPGSLNLVVHFPGTAEPLKFDGEQARKIMEYLNKHSTQE